ncbi:MAG TPA: type II toxin-antitoxin system VapC family toxin [Syntrophorhabdaceae bacterium]|nr:type II toxin-antitoxin system VapC family toxin [Syntrophorhabdaceae bacterium]HQM82430.1 type II toxin-antitoxin system VapC family toxin [Syntrophorhabdaceae bacterium]
MKNKPFIFDSHALLRLFQREKGFEKIAKLLEELRKKDIARLINAINVGEIIYITKREFGDQKKIEVLANIERMGFVILSAPNTLIFQAAEYKAIHNISYADSFVLASAVEHQATIVTGDPEFRKVGDLVEIYWI